MLKGETSILMLKGKSVKSETSILMLKGRAGRAAGVLTLVLNSLTARLPKFTLCVLCTHNVYIVYYDTLSISGTNHYTKLHCASWLKVTFF